MNDTPNYSLSYDPGIVFSRQGKHFLRYEKLDSHSWMPECQHHNHHAGQSSSRKQKAYSLLTAHARIDFN